MLLLLASAHAHLISVIHFDLSLFLNHNQTIIKSSSNHHLSLSVSKHRNALAAQAYDDGANYLFQLNDDLEFKTAGWSDKFTDDLVSNPLHANLGVTGPMDLNMPRILTQSFVARVHLDIFPTFYPLGFKNWYSDDWIR
jgi:hypothetical protein